MLYIIIQYVSAIPLAVMLFALIEMYPLETMYSIIRMCNDMRWYVVWYMLWTYTENTIYVETGNR